MTQPQGDAGQSGDGQGGTASDGAGSDGGGDGFKPITSQDDLNKLIGDRVARERQKFADYDDLKTKASQLDALADASKTETDRLTERLAAIEAERNAERIETMRLKIANAHGITNPDDLKFGMTGNDEASLTAQAKWLQQRDADRKKHGNHVPNEGTSGSVAGNGDRAFARQLLGGGD